MICNACGKKLFWLNSYGNLFSKRNYCRICWMLYCIELDKAKDNLRREILKEVKR